MKSSKILFSKYFYFDNKILLDFIKSNLGDKLLRQNDDVNISEM